MTFAADGGKEERLKDEMGVGEEVAGLCIKYLDKIDDGRRGLLKGEG